MPTSIVVASRLSCGPVPSRQLVADCLPNRVTTHGSWMLATDFPTTSLGSVYDLVRNGRGASEIVKRGSRRLVARMIDHPTGKDFVVKSRRVRGIRMLRRSTCPVRQEMVNQIGARDRGISTPQVLAYGQIPGDGGVSHRVLCMEWCPYRCMREAFLEGLQVEGARTLLRRAASSMRSLFLAGCNHVDFGPHAILMHPLNSRQDVIIDFESATFLSRPSARVLAAQLGYFGWSVAVNRNWVERDEIVEWRDHVFHDLRIAPTKTLVDEFERNLTSRQELRDRMNRRSRP